MGKMVIKRCSSSFPKKKKPSSVPQKKNIEVQNGALVRLKYIHSRILDHMKMKRFLESHQIKNLLNELGRLVTNVDEIESFRKRVKNMLLIINDSIMEFEHAVSSAEISLNSQAINKIVEKSSDTSSGVSTSLSSLDLTNRNFQTMSDNQMRMESAQNNLQEKINSVNASKENSSTCNSSLDISSLALTNISFHSQNNWTYGKKQQNDSAHSNFLNANKLAESNNRKQQITGNSLMSSIHKKCNGAENFSSCNSEDLFLEPFPLTKKNYGLKGNINDRKNEKSKKEQKHYESQDISTCNPELKIGNYDYINSLNKLSLGDIEININGSCNHSQSLEENKPDGKKDNELGNVFHNKESEAMSEGSEHSEIYSLTGMNSLCNVDPKDKQTSVTESDRKNANNLLSPLEYSNMNCPITLLSSMDSSENECFVSDSFGQIFSNTSNFHGESGPSKGVKRRIMNISTNLEMIDGHIIPECGKNCISLENYPTASIERTALQTSDIVVQPDRDLNELNRDLQEAVQESSKVWNDLNVLLDEAKKELMEESSKIEPDIGNLQFPPGYEQNYKYLDDILFEIKSTMGIPSTSHLLEDQDLFFEDAMNNWEEVQQIVHKIKKRDKEKKRSLQ